MEAGRTDADEAVDHAWVRFDEAKRDKRGAKDADEKVEHAWVAFQG